MDEPGPRPLSGDERAPLPVWVWRWLQEVRASAPAGLP